MTHRSKSEAPALQEQMIGLREAQSLATAELRDRLARERYALANMEVDAGCSDDAKALLESDLRQAELRYGENSADYGDALNYLFENRSRARDYASAPCRHTSSGRRSDGVRRHREARY